MLEFRRCVRRVGDYPGGDGRILLRSVENARLRGGSNEMI